MSKQKSTKRRPAMRVMRTFWAVLCIAVIGAGWAGADQSALAPGGKSFRNYFNEGEEIDLYVYTDVEENPFHSSGAMFEKQPLYKASTTFSWKGALQAPKEPLNVSLPLSVRSNRTMLYAHVFVTKKGFTPNLYAPGVAGNHAHTLAVLFRSVPLLRLLPEIPVVRKRFLLREPFPPQAEVEAAALAEANPEKPIVPYWTGRLAAHIIFDTTAYPAMTDQYVPPFLLYALNQMESVDAQHGVYLPIVHVDELGTLTKDLRPVNLTSLEMPLDVTLGFLGPGRYEWMLKMEQSVKMHKQMGTPDSEMEEVQRMFAETDTRLLVVTLAVSAVHVLFDFLAFGHDISFWNSLKSTKGVSVRAIFIGLVMESVVFLYLWDSGTSVLVLITVGGGILVATWKLYRANALHRKLEAAAQKEEKEEDVFDEEEASKDFDAIASRYMILLLGPPVAGYAVFSLAYMQQKGWTSWMLESAVSVVYAVGFMQMTPQLFLNYKYKSVDHLPWKALIYKALNTFIDDLFAFVIKMPGLHRLSVFRDDIVFFIYLYQRWIYTKRRPPPGTVKPRGEVEGGSKDAAAAKTKPRGGKR